MPQLRAPLQSPQGLLYGALGHLGIDEDLLGRAELMAKDAVPPHQERTT